MTMSPNNQHESLTILLVEDDDADAKAFRRALAKAAIANPVIRALDGAEALSLLRDEAANLPKHFMILADINMPRMTGLEMLQEIRADPAIRNAVVFILTTSNDETDRVRAYDKNVAGYVLKQNVGRDYMKLVDTLHRYWDIVELPAMKRSRCA